MTVCVGAICEGGKCAVVAADRMVTFGPPMMLTTQPPAFSKIQRLTDQVALLFAGSVADGETLVNLTRTSIGIQAKPSMAAIADMAKAAYASHKKRRVEETILAPYLGTDFPGFQALVAQSAASQVLGQVLGMVAQHNLQLEVLIAGLDDTGAHLVVVNHPGQVVPMNSTGFVAVGSGGIHAGVRMSLGQHTPSATLTDTLYNVYEAKRAAEVAPGVGPLTDMAVIKEEKTFPVSSELFKVLEDIHKDRPTPSADELKRLKEACDVCCK